MLKKQRHITGFLSLLICLGLVFSTVHSHEQFDWDQDFHSAPAELPNSVAKDANLCPVDGYLFSADVAHSITANIILVPLERNRFSPFEIYEQPSLLNLNNRSPPAQA